MCDRKLDSLVEGAIEGKLDGADDGELDGALEGLILSKCDIPVSAMPSSQFPNAIV